jgi:hypothetical protein
MQAEVSDGPRYKTLWIAEKWSEEAIDFGRRKLERLGVTHVPMSYGVEQAKFVPIRHGISSAILRAIVGPPEEAAEIHGNLLLNEGIQRLQDLTMIATPLTNQTAANAWGNTNAFIGVGTSNAAEAATQTDLSVSGFYKIMNATFPSRSSQTVNFASDFITSEANQVWAEWSIAAGATSASGGGFLVGITNLNRKVAALGTKASGTWTLTASITIS